jgi:dihydrodipicolinate synthase/N-acetylneuraminate lyase
VSSRTAEASARAARVRSALEVAPFHSALKWVLQVRGVAIDDAVRPPLPALTAEQRQMLQHLVEDPDGEMAPLLAAAAASR